MDKLERYRQLIKRFLQERADLMNRQPIEGIDTLCIFDELRDQYVVQNIGWHRNRRVDYKTYLVRLHNGKIWIEEDGTEEGLANLLVEEGVPKSDIVLAFNPPELRDLTEFAVA